MKNFPMFLKMADRRVLIIGGGEQAAQKARLILKTDAEICVLSDQLDIELQKYVDDGRIQHLNEVLTVELLQSASLIFSATGCAGAGAAHAELAKVANSLINVVDMPELCEAMTPSIVDRDPLVIAIGTEGNAPILGRQIKSKMETILEPGLGRLVTFAGSMRNEVAHRINSKDRRSFWNWVFNEKPRQEFSKGSERHAFDMIKNVIAMNGKDTGGEKDITFITADAPDADLMRLRDVRALQEADIIFYQPSLHKDILELARRDAERQPFRLFGQDKVSLMRIFMSPANRDKNVVVLSEVSLFDESQVNSILSA